MAVAALKQRFAALGAWWSRTFVGRAATRFSEVDTMTMGAALTFYSVLSLSPLVVLLLWITASLYPAAQEEFFQQVGSLVGAKVEEMTRTIVENAEREPDVRSMAGLLGTIALFLSASAVFAQLQVSLNRIFQCKGTRTGVWGWLRKRLLGLGVVLALGFLLLISMAAQALIALLAQHLSIVAPLLTWLLSAALYTLSFAALFWLLPDRDVDWKHSLIGGALTAVLFMVGRMLIGLYLGQAAVGSAYGPAGGLFVLLVWLYYSSLIFFAGAICTALLVEDAQDRRPPPGPAYETIPQSR